TSAFDTSRAMAFSWPVTPSTARKRISRPMAASVSKLRSDMVVPSRLRGAGLLGHPTRLAGFAQGTYNPSSTPGRGFLTEDRARRQDPRGTGHRPTAFAPARRGQSPSSMSNSSSSSSSSSSAPTLTQRLARGAGIIIVSSVMFTFISYWRTAAVVLCDLASTAYYIGGAVEQAIGPAAPGFILAVMCFSYAVRSVYIESCSLFVRGGAYRVVKEAMGGFLAKISVSALMFDYILTGPTSGVSAGQYIMGLLLDSAKIMWPQLPLPEDGGKDIKRWGSVLIACAVTLYFFRQNLLGIHESSGKALNIMKATTVMAVVI